MGSAAAVQRVEINGDGWTPLPTQARFLASRARHKAYIGPMGSGKSELICRAAIALSAAVPGNQGVIGRYTLQDFKHTTRVTLERVLPQEFVDRELPNNEGWVIRTSDPDRPSTMWAGHFDETGPYASMGLGWFAIDEVNGDQLSPSVPHEVFKMLKSRLGRNEAKHVRFPYGMLGGNPLGHNWVWKVFSPDSPDREPETEYFKPLPYENAKHLEPGYYERMAVNGPDWVSRYVEGSDDTFEGQVYPELTDSLHGVNPFPIPATWPRVIGLDHGLRNPTCVGFAAVSEDGVIFLYDEHYEAGRTVAYHAGRIKQRLPAMEKARNIDWPADPSIFSKAMQTDGRVFSIYDEYSDAGLDEWVPGENDIAAGRNRIKTMLRDGKLKFFRGRVPNLWREMTQLHWKRLRSLQDRDAPEQEADIDNHGPDMLRYLVMSRPDPAVRLRPKKQPTWQEQRLDFRRRHIALVNARNRAATRAPEDGYV